MVRSGLLLVATVFSGCGQPSTVAPMDPGFRPDPMDGYSAEDHVEVSPGVFLLSERLGSVAVLPTPTGEPRSATAMNDGCHTTDAAVYYDKTRYGSVLGGAEWAGSVYLESSDLGPWGSGDSVTVQGYTEVGTSSDSVSTAIYIYRNGQYEGYIYEAVAGNVRADASTHLAFDCPASGVNEIKARFSHGAYDVGADWLDFDSFSISKTLTARVECCPR
jgi:hypothetical protein